MMGKLTGTGYFFTFRPRQGSELEACARSAMTRNLPFSRKQAAPVSHGALVASLNGRVKPAHADFLLTLAGLCNVV